MKTRSTDRVRRLLLVSLAIIILITSTLVTATPQTNDRVVLYVTVTTENGDAVLDLTRENFSVSIDKRPRTILSFDGSDAPSSIGILIDTSGSLYTQSKTKPVVVNYPQNLKTGLERFDRVGHPRNEYFVMTFNKDVELLQDWTNDLEPVANKMEALIFKGQTALYDSMTKAIAKFAEARNPRRVLILVSDGQDSYSRSESKHVREKFKRSDVILYVVGVVDPPGIRAVTEGPDFIAELARDSGGRPLFSFHFATNAEAFNQAFEAFFLDLRSQYQLVIGAEETAGKEKWHKLNVTVTRNDASGRPQKLIVRTRKGYYR